MTKFSQRVPLARDSDRRSPRSWWDKQTLDHAARKPDPSMSAQAEQPPRPDFRQRDMRPALSMMQNGSRSEKRWRNAPKDGGRPKAYGLIPVAAMCRPLAIRCFDPRLWRQWSVR